MKAAFPPVHWADLELDLLAKLSANVCYLRKAEDAEASTALRPTRADHVVG
jgi:hypothetical protein